MTANHRYQEARRITLYGAVINAFLGTIKVVFGTVGKSHALFADGIHSFSDLLTDVLVLIASRFGSQVADLDHPYGHQRIETAATMFISLLLILVGIGIGYDAALHFFAKTFEMPSNYVLGIAFLSISLNELLYRWSMNKITKAARSR